MNDELFEAKKAKFTGKSERGILNSLNTHKGHLTRLATESTAVMETMKTSPNAKSTKRLEEIQEAMRDKKSDFEAAQEVLVDMLEDNPLKHDEYFTTLYTTHT